MSIIYRIISGYSSHKRPKHVLHVPITSDTKYHRLNMCLWACLNPIVGFRIGAWTMICRLGNASPENTTNKNNTLCKQRWQLNLGPFEHMAKTWRDLKTRWPAWPMAIEILPPRQTARRCVWPNSALQLWCGWRLLKRFWIKLYQLFETQMSWKHQLASWKTRLNCDPILASNHRNDLGLQRFKCKKQLHQQWLHSCWFIRMLDLQNVTVICRMHPDATFRHPNLQILDTPSTPQNNSRCRVWLANPFGATRNKTLIFHPFRALNLSCCVYTIRTWLMTWTVFSWSGFWERWRPHVSPKWDMNSLA